MAGFKKGLTYILYSEDKKHWYIVKQVGMKSWIATNFTHLDIDPDNYTFRHNALDLWKMLKPRGDYKVCTENNSFRKYMFDILQYGHFKPE